MPKSKIQIIKPWFCLDAQYCNFFCHTINTAIKYLSYTKNNKRHVINCRKFVNIDLFSFYCYYPSAGYFSSSNLFAFSVAIWRVVFKKKWENARPQLVNPLFFFFYKSSWRLTKAWIPLKKQYNISTITYLILLLIVYIFKKLLSIALSRHITNKILNKGQNINSFEIRALWSQSKKLT